jgi:hypothetical protein
MKELLQRQDVRYILTLLAGITVGALFYPTKHIETTVSQKYESEIASLKDVHQKELQEKDVEIKLISESKQYKEESDLKISKLTTEVKTLQSKQKTQYYKIVRPDGTIEIKKFTESEVNESSVVVTQIQEEFKKKVDEIENKWSSIHTERVTKLQKDFDSKEQEYQKQITELKKTQVVDINKKSFSVEAGVLTNSNLYGHATMDLWGPFMVGLHGETSRSGTNSSIGAGVGLRF